ncbi:nucleoside/nucleotide kinase family protein [Saccharothrix sp. ST-888]|uniref:nucleoside/nucleotide kinase family protein n=1 Tax=Saccharothrix sp. ST-888 TaxID=1427391 RepID=UPI000ACB19BB|nr:nucleoside/nucleotide kinase family protein [Saccharothrix sp. ST-888]
MHVDGRSRRSNPSDAPGPAGPGRVGRPATANTAQPLISGRAELLASTLGMLHGRTHTVGRSILGLAGPPGTGKSTLAHFLVEEINRQAGSGTAAHLPLDGFHLSNAQLERLGLRDRKGSPPSFDAWGYVALLRRVLAERFQDVYAPGFDRALDEPVAAQHVIRPHTRLVITEGNYLVGADAPWPEARALMGELWYVETDDHVRDSRLMQRHTDGGRAPDAARHWISSNDHPNGEYVKAGRAVCTRIVGDWDLPPVPDGGSVL